MLLALRSRSTPVLSTLHFVSLCEPTRQPLEATAGHNLSTQLTRKAPPHTSGHSFRPKPAAQDSTKQGVRERPGVRERIQLEFKLWGLFVPTFPAPQSPVTHHSLCTLAPHIFCWFSVSPQAKLQLKPTNPKSNSLPITRVPGH